MPPASGRTLDVLIEVDSRGERTGLAPADAVPGGRQLAALEGCALRGLMTLPPLGPATPRTPGPASRGCGTLRDGLREKHPEVLELSMGMSLDYEVAVEEGATMVRIGTALFGPRTP